MTSPPEDQAIVSAGDDDQDRFGEHGVIGAEQKDETHYYAQRDKVMVTNGDDDDDEEEESVRLKFPQHKLYGRDDELATLRGVLDRVRGLGESFAASNDEAENDDNPETNNQTGSHSIFLSGYSGSGKSALVHEFWNQLQNEEAKDESTSPVGMLMEGKFDELQTSDPFSAITQAMNRWCSSISNRNKNGFTRQQQQDYGKRIRLHLEQDLGADLVLLMELVPKLSRVLFFRQNARKRRKSGHHLNQSGSQAFSGSSNDFQVNSDDLSVSTHTSRRSRSQGGSVNTMNKTRIKYMFQCLIRAICHSSSSSQNDGENLRMSAIQQLVLVEEEEQGDKDGREPREKKDDNSQKGPPPPPPVLILFIDDLQWADDASLELLSALLGDPTLRNLMFIGAFRSNEVHEDHHVMALMKDLKESRNHNNDEDNNDNDSNDPIHILELSDLTQHHVNEFISDTLGVAPEETPPLTQAVFGKAMGNVFYTMQTLELLARQGSIYYDSVTFMWAWGNLSSHQLQDKLLSQDLMAMVQSKLRSLSPSPVLQHVMQVASYVRATFDVETLWFVLNFSSKATENETSAPTSKEELCRLLDKAVVEGLLLAMTSSNDQETDGSEAAKLIDAREFAFAHDRIQEAARTLEANEVKRYQLLISIGNALADRGMSDEDPREESEINEEADEKKEREKEEEDGADWMLFTAAHHLNSVPAHHFNEAAKKQLAKLNLLVAQLSTGVAGFEEASKSLRFGLTILGGGDNNNLNEDLLWSDAHYDLTIEIYNQLLDVEFGLGHHEELKQGIDHVLNRAKSLRDKGVAFVHSVGIISISKERDHALALRTGLDILAQLGIESLGKVNIDDVKATDIQNEEHLCKLALGDRHVRDLFDTGNTMEDETAMIVLDKMAHSSVQSGRLAFNYILSRVALRLCATHGISTYLPKIMVYDCLYYLRLNPDFKESYQVAQLCEEMLDTIPGITSETRCRVKPACYNGGFVLVRPLQVSVEAFLDCYGHGIRAGDTEWAFICAMCYGLTYCAVGCSISSLTEAKFAFYEEECRRFRQPPSVNVIFSVMRQFTISIQQGGKPSCPNPTTFDGKAMREREVLGHFDPDSAQFKQTTRDLNTLKLVVACIFGHAKVMEDMIESLKGWPCFDILICRGFLRNLFVGLASLALFRANATSLQSSTIRQGHLASLVCITRVGPSKNKVSKEKQSEEGGEAQDKAEAYLELANQYIEWFRDGAGKGDPNAKVALHCLLAERKQTKKNYDLAIQGCRELGMLHVEALLNERCGVCQMERQKHHHAEIYLGRSIQCYYDYGAAGKVLELRKTYSFLESWAPNDGH